MEEQDKPDAIVEAGGSRFVLAGRMWDVEPSVGTPAPKDLRARVQSADAEYFAIRLNELALSGYHPDRVLALAEAARDRLGATIVFVREQVEDPEDSDDIVY